jgi:hypothetical protein
VEEIIEYLAYATVRELGLGLADVRRVLAGQAGIAEVAAAHRDALDAQIRVLQLHRAALAVVVKRAAGDEERAMMDELARMLPPAASEAVFIADVDHQTRPRSAG